MNTVSALKTLKQDKDYPNKYGSDFGNSNDNDLKNNLICLNLFERAVQDPCSQDCDCEDDILINLSTFSNSNDDDDNNNNNNNNNSGIDENIISNSLVTSRNISNSLLKLDKSSPGSPSSSSTSTSSSVSSSSSTSILTKNREYENEIPTVNPLITTTTSMQNTTTNIIDEISPLEPNLTSSDSIMKNKIINSKKDENIETKHLKSVTPPSWKNPFNSSKNISDENKKIKDIRNIKPINSINKYQTLRKVQTLPFIDNNSYKNNKKFNSVSTNEMLRARANSTCLLQKLSRRSERNPLTRNDSYNSTISSTNNNYTSRKKTNEETEEDEVEVEKDKGNYDYYNNNRSPSRSIISSPSSRSSFLTHLCGLEKYVSSDLDALSTESFKDESTDRWDRINIVDFSSTLGSKQFDRTKPRSLSLNNNLNNFSNNYDLNTLYSDSKSEFSLQNYNFNNKRKRRQSFIEKSLANSFSQH